MVFLRLLSDFLKKNKNELLIIKILVLIAINTWLLIIFWKIIVLGSGANIINNNIAVLKIQTLLQPFLQILGIDILNPNTLKMIIISCIVILSNLSVLYFNQMLAFFLLGICARYSYKAYNNYINKDTLNYYGFEKIKELSMQEKNEIFNEFLIEKALKDENLIGFLQHKLNNTSNLNKNELILTLNNNLLEYKQQLIGKLLLEQNQQILAVNAKTSKTWLDTLDINTLLKIGGILIIVGLIVGGGYYYYNTNAVTAAKDMSKEVLDSNKIISDGIANTTAQQNIIINDQIKNISEKLLENNNIIYKNLNQEIDKISTEQKNINLDIYNKIDEYNQNIYKKATEVTVEILKEQKSVIDEGKNIIKTIHLNNDNINSLTNNINNLNTNVVTITQNLNDIAKKTKELDFTLNGGSETNPETNEITEYASLIGQVIETSNIANIGLNSVNAILSFLGVDNELNINAQDILRRIRAANGNQNDNANPEL